MYFLYDAIGAEIFDHVYVHFQPLQGHLTKVKQGWVFVPMLLGISFSDGKICH